MDADETNAPETGRISVERKAQRDLVVTRTFASPAARLFDAWTKPALLRQWWGPKSMGVSLHACEIDLRPGGRYRFEIGQEASKTMAFFGQYREVTPPQRLVWTNEESDTGPVTTLTLTETEGGTVLVLHELYPSAEARDAAFGGMEGPMAEMFTQLDALLATLSTG